MDDRSLLKHVGYNPFSSCADIAVYYGEDEQRVRRHSARLIANRQVAAITLGALERGQGRLMLSTRGVADVFETSHSHPRLRQLERASEMAADDPNSPEVVAFKAKYDLTHWHFPFGNDDSHEHAPWTATEDGAKRSISRLPLVEQVNRLAPGILASRNLNLGAAPPGFDDPPLTQITWLRKGGFYHAVSRHGPDVWVAWTFVGHHASERVMRDKFDARYWGLAAIDANGALANASEVKPQPSAHVIITVDDMAAESALRLFGDRGDTLVWAPNRWMNGPKRYRVSRSRLLDPFDTPPLGHPDRLLENLASGSGWEPFRGTSAFRLFIQTFETVGLDHVALAEIVGVSKRRALELMQSFIDEGLVSNFEGGYYPDDKGFQVAADISRTSKATVKNRFECFLGEEYRTQQWAHNEGIGKIARHLAKQGVRVFGGWRYEINIPGVTQLKPDGWVQAFRGSSPRGLYALEYERSAKASKRIGRKQTPFRKLMASGYDVPALVVCESEAAVRAFVNEAGVLPLWVTTLPRLLESGPHDLVWTDGEGRSRVILFWKQPRHWRTGRSDGSSID